MAYKVKEGEVSVAGFAQSFTGEVSDDLYKLIVKKSPKSADLFVKVGAEPEVKVKKDKSAPIDGNV